MIELEAGDAWMTVHPEDGGRIGRLEVGERSLLQDDRSRGPLLWGCYPMVPWAGRVRHGRFLFDGVERRLPVNLPPHAIHGSAFEAPWEVVNVGRDHCELQCPLTWEFGGIAHQHLQLHEHGLTCVLTAQAGTHAMPAVIGWHPCFRTPASVQLEFGEMYLRDAEGVTVAERTNPKPHPWDDCFVRPLAPLRLLHPDLVVSIASDCDHWVVYDEQADMIGVEPQSGPPEAFNIGGATRLEPGDLLQRRMILTWTRCQPPVTPG